ncbi:hypothetical protein [Sphingobacterium siyangense]|uniref:nSTAND3 domain-containing NTPase n=1 Tax=Sphingobacterium siyangense TaxID=459529 RepID=UPI002FDE6879
MERINWSNFDSTVFTLFCNSLLSLEVGKGFVPFSAPGKDGGIDGSFEGSYGERTGKWRFQYKFHQIARKQAVSTLKYELKEEIGKLKDENHFVFITNVELLPKELKELNDLFSKEIVDHASSCELEVWDGAKLHTLYIKYPLLELWLNEGFNTAQLQEYSTFFSKEMQLKFEPGTLSNIFISREKDMEQLEEFLYFNSTVSLITGEAGIGKTRLVIEFFRKFINPDNNWIGLVLASRNIQIDTVRKVLSSEKKSVVLIDDAHNYNSEVIREIKRLAESFNGKVKLIMTARTLQAFQSLELIKEYEQEQILKIELATLERHETKCIFDAYLSKTPYKHYINELVGLSYGRPILIVAVLRAIQDKVPISDIRENGFLKNYVINYFDGFYKKISDETGISKLRLKILLQNIALIEPFSYDDTNLIAQLSEIHEIGILEIKLSLKTLKEFSFVSGRFEQSIKPDYYSDILLLDINTEDASHYISQFNTLLDNIIINLSSVDEVGNTNSKVLDEILENFVSWIFMIENVEDLDYERKLILFNRIINTIRRIVFVRPEIAKKCIANYISCFDLPDHPVVEELRRAKEYKYRSGNWSLEKIIRILKDLNTLPQYYRFVLKSAIKLYELTGDKDIPSIYNFSKHDVINHYGLSMQNFFIQEFLVEASKREGANLPLLLDVVKRMFSLNFTSTENSNSSMHSITITTYYVPDSENVKKFRLNAISKLISIYNIENLINYRKEILEQLLDIPRGLFARDRDEKPFDNDEEIELVLNFLEQNGNSFGIAAQKEILDRLFWYEKWDITPKFIPQIVRIKDAIAPKSLAEELGRIFLRSEMSLKDYTAIQEDFEVRVSDILEQYDEDEVAKALSEFLLAQQYQPFYFYEFLRLLVKKSSKHGLKFHDTLLENERQLYYQYASSVLYIIYFEKSEKEAYWNRIDQLEALNNSSADNVILSIYGTRVPGTADLIERDVKTILRIYNKKNKENNFNLANGLQSLITAKYPRVYEVTSDYLDRAQQRDAEMFFLWLSDNKMASAELMKNLVINHSVRFGLSHQIERVLSIVLKEYGQNTVFEYLISRYYFKKKIVEKTKTLMGYEFLPDGEHSSLFNGQTDLKEGMYFQALNWYLNEDAKGGHLYYGKDIFEYLQPSSFVTNSIYEKYKEVLEAHANDPVRLTRIADSLEVFHSKNSFLVKLILKGYGYVVEPDNIKHNEETIKDASSAYYIALISSGVKTGTPGQPFQADIDLRDLLEAELLEIPQYLESRKIITAALDSVKHDINNSSDLDNETW